MTELLAKPKRRRNLYVLIREGSLPVKKLGIRTLILKADLDAFIAGLPAGGPK